MTVAAYGANCPLPSLEDIIRENPGYLDELISPAEAAKFGDTTVKTLSTQRNRGGGPVYYKNGGRISYTRRDLLERARRGRRRSTSDNGQSAAV